MKCGCHCHTTTRACHWRHGHRTHCNATVTPTLQTYRGQRKNNWWVGSRSDSQTATVSSLLTTAVRKAKPAFLRAPELALCLLSWSCSLWHLTDFCLKGLARLERWPLAALGEVPARACSQDSTGAELKKHSADRTGRGVPTQGTRGGGKMSPVLTARSWTSFSSKEYSSPSIQSLW